MPITATPASGEISCDTQHPGHPEVPSVPVDCVGQRIFVATPPTEPTTGAAVPTRTHSVVLQGGQDGEISWIMRDTRGMPIDLSACVCDEEGSSDDSSGSSGSSGTCQYALLFRMSEALDCSYIEKDVTIVDAANGEVSIPIASADIRCPGIYFGEVAMVNAEDHDVLFFSNRFDVTVNRGLWSSNVEGPPTVAEVRLHLRDSSPAESFLLNGFRFSDEEISAAIVRPVMYFNETPPTLGTRYNTNSFPFRFHWMEAIAAYLFIMAAEKYRANQLAYQAGTRIDDQNKEPNYEAAAQRRLNLWHAFVINKKDEINRAEFTGSSLSAYSYYGW